MRSRGFRSSRQSRETCLLFSLSSTFPSLLNAALLPTERFNAEPVLLFCLMYVCFLSCLSQGVRRVRGGLRMCDRPLRPHRRREERPLAAEQGRPRVLQASMISLRLMWATRFEATQIRKKEFLWGSGGWGDDVLRVFQASRGFQRFLSAYDSGLRRFARRGGGITDLDSHRSSARLVVVSRDVFWYSLMLFGGDST